jgi:dihydropteroate synthase
MGHGARLSDPRTDSPRPPGALALAGSAHVWFDPAGLAHAARFAHPRPVLAGLPVERPLVMGILNVTPDSFSDGGAHAGFDAALAQARRLLAEGADILDIGGESTRPGAADVPPQAEIARTVPVIKALRAAGIGAPVSIDTRKAIVAEAAVAAGANMVNDVSALSHDPAMAGVVAALGVPVCLMHAQGTPRDMQADPRYGDVVAEVYEHLAGGGWSGRFAPASLRSG